MISRPAPRVRSGLALMVVLVVGLALSGEEGRAAEDSPALPAAGRILATPADANDTLSCQRLATLIEQQKTFIVRETGQLRRELAALREDLTKPGMREILAGIGYIFGLAGIVLYLRARRTTGR
jgi:hypothetical protein